MDAANPFAAQFEEAAANIRLTLTPSYLLAVGRAVDLLEHAFRARSKLLVFGNGGSAADAQHITAELVGRYSSDRAALPAIALTDNPALLTAWSNDRSFDDVFARQIEALGAPGDVAWGISTSGSSPNVLRGLRAARTRGLQTIGLTGRAGTEFLDLCDVALAIPLSATPRVQEVHVVTYHVICGAVEDRVARS